MNSESTMAMIEEMKTKNSERKNLAEAYAETSMLETSVDDEINNAIGTDLDVQKSLEAMKQNY